MKWKCAGLVGISAAALLLVGCTATQSSAQHPSSVTAPAAPLAQVCPVTSPTRDFVPGFIGPQWADPVSGHGNLWVGAWWKNPQSLEQARTKADGDSAYPYVQKYPTWAVRGGAVTNAGGAPRVSVKSLDGHGHGRGDTGGYTNASLDDGTSVHWWPTLVRFPTTGCWQVTETVGEDSIVYVVKI
jgi:hypothetical protein